MRLQEEIAKRKQRRGKPAPKTPEPSANGHAEAPPPLPEALETTDTHPFPDDARPEAFAGVLGELTDVIDPHTEASRVAILLQALVAFGNVIGRTAHFRVERTKHHLNLFAVIVGNTAKARKGTSWDRVREPFAAVDPAWFGQRVQAGMSSGEGLIWEIRDPVVKMEMIREAGRPPGWEEVEMDRGIEDKRLLVVETEFASVLKQFERQGNVLSMVLRQAWESGDIKTLSKNSPARATGAHLSIIGHTTAEELKRFLTSTEAANGLGNRFLWAAVRRSKLLPEGGGESNLQPLFDRIAAAVSFARCVAEMPRDDEARELWFEVYPKLSCERLGLVGSLLARAEAQTMRLACLYALLDCSHQVEAKHLRSGLALWDYCQRSAEFIFGDSTGDVVADEILTALRKRRKEGVSRSDIISLFSNHQSKEKINRALTVLAHADRAHVQHVKTAGRPLEIWFYGPAK